LLYLLRDSHPTFWNSHPAIYNVFRERCFDHGSKVPWGHTNPWNKIALSPELVKMRWASARAQKKLNRPKQWFSQNVIYIDACNTVLSDSLKTGFDETQPFFGKAERWMSDDSERSSRNLRASPYATKQPRVGDKRIWWFAVLTSGKVGYMGMPDHWNQTGDGMAEFVSEVDSFLCNMLGEDARLPRVLVSDGGPCFYQTTTGHIVEAYRRAAASEDSRIFAGCQ
jgi:hypothetical protein